MADGAMSDDRNIETTEALNSTKSSPLRYGETADRSCSGTIGYRGPRNSLERLSEATYQGIKDINGCAKMSALLGTSHVL